MPMRSFVLAVGFICASLAGALAQEADREKELGTLFEVLKLSETISILRQEAIANGRDLSETFLGDPASEVWMAEVRRINDPERMRSLVEAEMSEALKGEDIAGMIAFFDRPEGQRILKLELAARDIMTDASAAEAAILSYQDAREDGAPIIAHIDRMTEDSDLIERNVEGALNTNLMFFRGMADGGAYDETDTEMARDVWRQEPELREEMTDWLGAFQFLAYAPLDDALLKDYGAFLRTPEGRALNHALFEGFNRMLDETSYLTGRALADHALAERL
ncbi:DUF2059 domain-containing protein [Roseovarius sp. E0-M6]|uniref:DUF2059 domain-containing protein n=1 Tax=Roseovarius sp. E0-M6 TaxID=3127118 RepID=UPI00300FA5B9